MLNLHAIWPRSRANGPGIRTVLWFQGCTLGCSGCFNPTTHPSEPRWTLDAEELVARIMADERAIEGITISGIDPLFMDGPMR